MMDDRGLQNLSKEELLDWIQHRLGRLNMGDGSQLTRFPTSSPAGFPDDFFVPTLFTNLPFTVYVRPLNLDQAFNWISDHSVHLTGYDSCLYTEEPGFWEERIHPQDKKRVLAVMAAGRDEPVIELEYRFHTADGRWIYVLDRSVVVSSGAAGDRSDYKIVGGLLDVTQRRELERQVSGISEEEKQKLGRDLHDDLCQQLTCVELLVHSMQRRMAQTGHLEFSKLDDLLHHVRKAIVTTQTMARGLSTSGLGDLGLPAALNHWLSKLDTVLPIRIRFHGPEQLRLRDDDAAVHIYRIAQEAIQNAVKHSGASEIEVSLAVNGNDLTLRIADNGVCKGDIHAHSGLGMKTMHYRSSLLNALLQIEQNDHGGVTVRCEIPFIVEADDLDH